MSRRGSGNLFGDSEPHDSIPGIEELIHGAKPARPSRFSRTPLGRRIPLGRRPPRWPLHVLFWLFTVAVFLFGILAMIAGATQAATDYGAASTFAGAPACSAKIDLTSTSENCVGDKVLPAAPGGAYSIGDGDELPLVVPQTSAGIYLFVDYPGNAQFDKAVGDGSEGPVRAEFWEGQVVTLTAGSPGITVTTNANPSNEGGVGIGDAMLGVAFVSIAALLLLAFRPLRNRWIPPGLWVRLTACAMIIWTIATFAAGASLIVQPARIALVAIIVPSMAVFVCGLFWIPLYKSWQRQTSLRAVAWRR